MNTVTLGSTGIEVTELCFGALPIGPMQKNVDVETASDVIAHALNSGITYIDTAKMYGTYEHIRLALEKSGKRPVISSKSTSSDYDGMMNDVLAAREALGVDHVDIFFLHAARVDASVFQKREGALRALVKCKEKGIIKAVGISTHDVKATVRAAAQPEIDIVFPLINMAGKGVLNGNLGDMEAAVESCFAANKGVVFMKVLGGGCMLGDYEKAMAYAMDLSKGRATIAIGMVSKPEVDMNMACFDGADISRSAGALKKPDKRFIVVDVLCASCGSCVEACHSDAISLADGKAVIDNEKCLTCGYCAEGCKEFAIRMV